MPERDQNPHIANVDQAAAWDGAMGAHWVEQIAMFDAMSSTFRHRLLEAIGLQPDEHVLDIGCGAGGTTLDIARAASRGSVLGVDLSSQMLGLARQRAADAKITNARFERADAQTHPFVPGSFDCVVSQFGVMFFADSVAAFENLWRALRPGGRCVMLTWQVPPPGSWLMTIREAAGEGAELPPISVDQPSPLGLATEARTRGILEAAGFIDVRHTPVLDPVRMGSDADEALRNLTVGIGVVDGQFANLDGAAREQALERLRSALRSRETASGVFFETAAWLVTARKA